MGAPRLLVVIGSLAALGGGLYTAFAYLAPNLLGPSWRAGVVSSYGADEHEGGNAPDLSALRREINVLRADFDADLGALKREQAETGTLRTRVASLEDEIAALREQVGHAARARESHPAAPTADGAPDFEPATREDMALIQEEQAYEDEERRRALGETFRAQSIDATWSPDTTDLITQAFNEMEPAGTELYGAECRSSLCRAEVSHVDAEAAREFDFWFPMQVVDALKQAIYYREPQDDGRMTTVLYLVREGHDLPNQDR